MKRTAYFRRTTYGSTTVSLLGFLLLSFSFTNAAVLQDAIQWGYNQGLTRYTNSTDFRAYDTLRRDEAAKFFVEFVNTQNFTTNSKSSCTFSDQTQATTDLVSYLRTSCEYGIFLGSNGKFMPAQKLTNAQTVAVVVRIIDWLQSEVGLAHRADNYYKRAVELGLSISGFRDKNASATRGNVMMLLYNAANGGSNNGNGSINGASSVDNVLQQIVDILNE